MTAQQFQWNFRYPGPDGKFGRTDLTLVSSTNQIGLDEKDRGVKGRHCLNNEMHIPVNRPIVVRLRSKDVIHSFFLPAHRVKQDAVPGLAIEVPFTPTIAGNFELACAELCGAQHYKMKGLVTVDASEEEFNNWLEGEVI